MAADAGVDLTLAHRAAQTQIAGKVAGDVLDVWRHANLANVDASWPVVAKSIARTVDAGHAQSVKVAANYLTEHARLYGVTLDAIKAGRLNVDQLTTALRVTGPVAFKIATGNGMSTGDAQRAAGVQLVGASMRLALLGGRATTQGTVTHSPVVAGFRRVGSGSSCEFCSMLISRGAVYRSAESAGTSSGSRTWSKQPAGHEFHDHCHCQVEPLYEGDAEPLDVDVARRRYLGLDPKPTAETAPLPEPVEALPVPIAERDLSGVTDDDLSELLGTASSDADVDAVVAELDRRDEVARAAEKDAAQKARRKDQRDAKRQAEADAKDAEYQRLLDEGQDPESAYADAFGVDVERQRRDQAIASLRSNGYKGRNFDELSRSAFQDHVDELVLDAENATRGALLNGTTSLNETRNVRKLFDGNEAYARANASEELLAYWQEHGRATLDDFRASLLGGQLNVKAVASWY